MKYNTYVIYLLFYILMFGIFSSCHSSDIMKLSYNQLDLSLQKKQSELQHYFGIVEKSFSQIKNDGPLIHDFQQLQQAYHFTKDSSNLEDKNNGIESIPEVIQINDKRTLNEIEQSMIDIYLDRFLLFSDILFIDLEGNVFYSLQKGDILFSNLFSGEYEKSSLSQSLINDPLLTAVDFDFFNDKTASAFFVHPVVNDINHIGWAVFELDSSHLEMTFSIDPDLGQTGEIFLVSQQQFMMTPSHFSADLAVLKQHLSADNISKKFTQGSGHEIIIDYRGKKAITSFQVIEVMNLNWLLVAKMDLDEVITLKYKTNRSEYYKNIRLKTKARKNCYLSTMPSFKKDNEVKLDQFKRVSKSGSLYTHGVSTCTAMLITLPGRFSYLAHISAYDALYGSSYTDLIGNMMNRIRSYEIPDYLIPQLEFYVISPVFSFSGNIVDHLTDKGLLLSQIHLIKNEEAKYANIYHNLDTGELYIQWKMIANEKTYFENGILVPNLSEISL